MIPPEILYFENVEIWHKLGDRQEIKKLSQLDNSKVKGYAKCILAGEFSFVQVCVWH